MTDCGVDLALIDDPERDDHNDARVSTSSKMPTAPMSALLGATTRRTASATATPTTMRLSRAYFVSPEVHSATTSVADWRKTMTLRVQFVSGAVAVKAKTMMISIRT